jgi:hypothetical protein
METAAEHNLLGLTKTSEELQMSELHRMLAAVNGVEYK